MIISRGLERVGSWVFGVPYHTPSRGAEWRAEIVSHVGHVLSLLQDSRLMNAPYSVALAGGSRERRHRTAKAADISATAKVIFDALSDESFDWKEFDVEGPGEVDLPNGTVATSMGVAELGLLLHSRGFDVSISTRCDAWLDFDLDARPQRELARANSSRLRAALERIETALNDVGYGENTRFARCEGYILRHREAHGEPLDLADLGLSANDVRELE